MKNAFKKGDIKTYQFKVEEADLATFNGEVLHAVCSTYKLGQEMEWSSRLFMLDIIDEDEEGVGTMLHIEHKSPAFTGETVTLTATYDSFESGELICSITVVSGDRLIATGKTGQRLLKKNRLKKLFTK